MSLLPFGGLKVVIKLLSGTESLDFIEKYLNLCSEDILILFYGFVST